MKKINYMLPWLLQTLIWIPTRVCLKIFCSYKVRGLENLKKIKKNNQGVIFTVNHSSEWDPIMIPASIPFLSHLMPMFYVSRERKFYANSGWRQYIYGGSFFNAWGAYPVYTKLNDYEKALQYHIKILNNKKSICIFPEGKKTLDGKIQVGKPGSAFLAYRTNSIIVPVRIKGLFKKNVEKDKLGRRKIDVIFGEPVYPESFFNNLKKPSSDDFKKAVEIVMDKIKKL